MREAASRRRNQEVQDTKNTPFTPPVSHKTSRPYESLTNVLSTPMDGVVRAHRAWRTWNSQ